MTTGVQALAAKLLSADGTIAYMGASVTEQREGFRPRLHERLNAAFGREHRMIDAGTGAMGCLAGLFLMDDLVLRHHPGVCFVEYASSDAAGTTPLWAIGPVHEAIVGKLRAAGCEPCFLHLFRADAADSDMAAVRAQCDAVAAHHGVLSIDAGARFDALLREGRHSLDELMRDVVHTTALGSDVVAEAVLADLEHAIAEPSPSPDPPAAALFEDGFSNIELVPARPEHALEPQTARPGTLRFFYPYVEIDAANAFRARFDGELVGLLVVAGPEAGVVSVGVEEFSVWDPWCSHDRLSAVVFPAPQPASSTLTIRLTDAAPDYATARRPVADPDAIERTLKLIAFMVRG